VWCTDDLGALLPVICLVSCSRGGMEEFQAKAQHRQLSVGAGSGGTWQHFSS
jgi:hypothetical protein